MPLTPAERTDLELLDQGVLRTLASADDLDWSIREDVGGMAAVCEVTRLIGSVDQRPVRLRLWCGVRETRSEAERLRDSVRAVAADIEHSATR